MAGLAVIDLSKRKRAIREAVRSGLDVAGWNAGNPLHPKDERGRWSDRPVLKGESVMDSVPARLADDGLGDLNPHHVPGSIEWTKGNKPRWSKLRSAEILHSMERYRGADFGALNKKLRGMPYRNSSAEFEGQPARFEQFIERLQKDLDTVIGASRLPEPIEVWRGTATGRGVFGSAVDNDLTGFEWTEGAYVSTTANENVADDFTITSLLMKIRVPAGTGAVALSGWSRQAGPGDWFTDDGQMIREEAEVLLERGLHFRVVSDSGKDPGGKRILEIEVVR